MLITFKSKAAAEVTMYQEHAQQLLDLLNKDVQIGVITAAEAPAALKKIEAVVAEHNAHDVAAALERDVHAHHGPEGDDNEHEPVQAVKFSARAYPLLEMLRAAAAGGHDILWGV